MVSLKKTQSGFTLMELVMTVAIMGIIIAQTYTIINTTILTGEYVENKVYGSEVLPAIMSLMTDDLKNIVLYDLGQEKFLGDQLSIAFYTMNPGFEFKDQKMNLVKLSEVTYYLKDSPTDPKYKVLMRRLDTSADKDLKTGGNAIVVYDKIKSMEFEYLNLDEQKVTVKEVQWYSSVKSGKLPNAVSVKLELFLGKVKKKKDEEDKTVTVTFKVTL
ncbi:MAG: prepilin-type N-terminal cleavage/methylation domain-containing protein [Planctomycetes bacterium]|nr:prepilin-type N-terminal cleavage/methylation domain-containing protein [Planctomycetota bacterium]